MNLCVSWMLVKKSIEVNLKKKTLYDTDKLFWITIEPISNLYRSV